MSRLFRWQGLAAFSVIVGLLAVFFYLFAESLIKTGIEKGAGFSLGAEVNVEQVKLTYSPISISVINFQATDAEQPSHNAFSFTQATVGFDLWQYLFGKIIIDDLTIDGLLFNQKRAEVGEVYLEPVKSEAELASEESSLLPALDVSLPDAKTLLADSNLATVKQAEALELAYQTESKKLKALKDKLPNKTKLASYQKRLKALTKVKVKSLDDIAKIKKQYEQLKKEFKADKALIKQAKTQLKKTKKIMTEQVSLMKNAPGQDWQNIEKKYQLDQLDAEDFAHILFGKQAREYYQTAEMIYGKVKPFLDKNKAEKDEKSEQMAAQISKGRFIYFKDDQPLPSFLVKTARISLHLPQGDFLLAIEELTHQHWFRDKPTKVLFNSTNINNSGTFVFDSEFRLTEQQAFSAAGKWALEKLALENVSFRKSKKLNLMLTTGVVVGSGQFVIEANALGSVISNINHINLTNSSYQGDASSHLGNILIDTFKSMDNFSLVIKLSGALDDPDFTITSELDKLLKNAFDQQVKQKLNQFKAKVQSGLNDKLKAALKINNKQANELLNIEGLLTDTDKTVSELLKSDVVKQQEQQLKNKLKNKVEDKLKEKFGKFLGG